MTNPVCTFLYEIGHLKRSARTGWWGAGVPGQVESVAEHSFRTGIIAYVIGALEGADADRAATLGLMHDVPETRIGDIPHAGRRYLDAMPAELIAKEQVNGLPGPARDGVLSVVTEFEQQQTDEAVCARDADKLECLLQAREYERAGARDVQAWIDSSLAVLRTETGRRLGRDAMETEPGAWWHAITAARNERRA